MSLVQILHWPNVNFSWHKKWISEAPPDQGVNWYPERAVSEQVWYSWALYVGYTQNREWYSFPRETRIIAQWPGEVKMSSVVYGLNATSDPTKMVNLTFCLTTTTTTMILQCIVKQLKTICYKIVTMIINSFLYGHIFI